MSVAKTMSGAGVVCYINGTLYTPVKGLSWSSATPHKPIGGIDTLTSVELTPISSGVTGTLSLYRLIGDTGAQGVGMAAPNFQLLSSMKYFDIRILDIASDTVIFAAKQCVVETEAWDVPSKTVVTGNISFRGILWANSASIER